MNMKRTLLTCITALMAFPLFAQYNGEGFYRIKNRGEAGRYISIINNKISEQSKNFNPSISSTYSQYVNAEALKCVKSKDSNPGTILYVKGNTSSLTLEAQGMNTDKLLQEFGYAGYQLKMSSRGELYTSYSGYQIDLVDFGYTAGEKVAATDCGVATIQFISKENVGTYAQWDFKKIDNENEFLGINPDVNIQVGQNENKYYTTLYTTFAYQLSDGMKAYYIDNEHHIYDTNHVQEPIAELIEINDGKIPQNTPVIIECSSNNVANNKVTLLNETLNPISNNALKGCVFCYIPTQTEDQGLINAIKFDKGTMRVIGFVDGELALVNEANRDYFNSLALTNGYIPANKVYFPINSADDAAATANGIKLLKHDEYNKATSISKVVSEDKVVKEGIYTLTGVKVKDTNSTENLPSGIYIINGKKQVIR